MVVSVVSEPAFRAGRPRKLFDGRYAVEPGGQHDYDVSPDGERFLMIAVDEPSAPNEMRVVLDWFEELSKLAPVP